MPTPISTAEQKKIVRLGNKQPVDNGSYALGFDVDFTADNIRTFSASGGDDMTYTQSMFIDNCASDKKLIVRFRDLSDNFEIAIPAKSSACIPVFSESSSNIEFESQFNGSISVILSSLAFPSYILSPEGITTTSEAPTTSQVSTVSNINIGVGDTTSQIFARNALNLTGFLIDAAATGILELQGSLDGSNFYPMRSSTGEKATYKTTAGAGIYYIDNIQESQPTTHFRLVSDTAQAGSTLNITPIMEQLIKG